MKDLLPRGEGIDVVNGTWETRRHKVFLIIRKDSAKVQDALIGTSALQGQQAHSPGHRPGCLSDGYVSPRRGSTPSDQGIALGGRAAWFSPCKGKSLALALLWRVGRGAAFALSGRI